MAETTKADDIALALEQQIVAGDLTPGQVLRQETLSEQFAVSRTPVREALRRLAALGLVSFEPNRGVRVRTLADDELYQAFLVRAELESLVTELATRKRTPADLEELEAAHRRFAEVTDDLLRADTQERPSLISAWVQANQAFHDVIYRIADAPIIERIAKSARRTFSGQAVWDAGGAEVDVLYEANVLQHRAILDAVAAGSAAGERALAREHVLSSYELLRAVRAQVGDHSTRPRLRSA